jgi:hypothetical protein
VKNFQDFSRLLRNTKADHELAAGIDLKALPKFPTTARNPQTLTFHRSVTAAGKDEPAEFGVFGVAIPGLDDILALSHRGRETALQNRSILQGMLSHGQRPDDRGETR